MEIPIFNRRGASPPHQAGAYAFVGKDDLLKLVHLLEREQP